MRRAFRRGIANSGQDVLSLGRDPAAIESLKASSRKVHSTVQEIVCAKSVNETHWPGWQPREEHTFLVPSSRFTLADIEPVLISGTAWCSAATGADDPEAIDH